MTDYFLIAIIVIFTFLSLFVGFYAVIHFQHPEDRHTSWFPKIIVTLSLGISAMNVLLLPLDSLNRSSGSTIPIELLCWGFSIASGLLVFFIIPFTMSYYENIEDEEPSPIKSAIWSLIPFILFVIGFGYVLLVLVGRCEIPIESHISYDILENLTLLNEGSNCSMYFFFFFLKKKKKKIFLFVKKFFFFFFFSINYLNLLFFNI